ncbi:MAG: hypothetical protein WDZ59_11610 [Pirellulales bacterium]
MSLRGESSQVATTTADFGPLAGRWRLIALWVVALLLTAMAVTLAATALRGGQPGTAALQPIATLTAEEKARLERKFERFQSLPPEEQARLWEIHGELELDPGGDVLRLSLIRYSDWLKTVTPSQRTEILALIPELRILRIREIREDQAKRRQRIEEELAEQEAREVSPTDRDLITKFMAGFVEKNREQILDSMERSDRRDFYRRNDSDEEKQLALSWQVLGSMWNPRDRDEIPQNALLKHNDVAPLFLQFSQSGRDRLAAAKDDEDRLLRFRHMLFVTLNHDPEQGRRRYQEPRISQQALEEFFATELDNEQRHWLLSLRREDMERELRWLYLRSGLDEAAWGRGRGRRGGGDRDRRGDGRDDDRNNRSNDDDDRSRSDRGGADERRDENRSGEDRS